MVGLLISNIFHLTKENKVKALELSSKVVFVLILLVSSFCYKAQAQQHENGKKYVKIEVYGLSDPYTCYGLEKKLTEIEGVANYKINFDTGAITLTVPFDSKVTKLEIKQKVEDAGFSLKNVVFKDKPFNNQNK